MFLETNLEFQNGALITVHCKLSKLPSPWNSKIAKKYNCIVKNRDLHTSKRKSTGFTMVEVIIKNRAKKADFPMKFLNSAIKRFAYNERNKDQQDDFIIPS